MKRIIVYDPSNSRGFRMIIPVAPKLDDESVDDYLARIYQKAVSSDPTLAGLPYETVDASSLPDEPSREKWVLRKGQPPSVDLSVVTGAEKHQALEDEIDRELESDNPDPVKVVRLARKIEKREF